MVLAFTTGNAYFRGAIRQLSEGLKSMKQCLLHCCSPSQSTSWLHKGLSE